MKQRQISQQKHRTERGFTLIEVMISIVVMTIGILAVLASFATAIAATASAEEDLVARHKALDAMESIYTARNSQQLPFASINNRNRASACASFLSPINFSASAPATLIGSKSTSWLKTFLFGL